MAKQNFLNSSFSGTLGGVVGMKTKGGHAIRVKKQYICHNGEQSRKALVAFTCLHRMCCKLAPALTDNILAGVKPARRIPTLEKIFTPWIKNNSFPPNGITNIEALQLSPIITNEDYDPYQYLITFDFFKGADLPQNHEGEAFFFIHNEAGQVKATHTLPYEDNAVFMQLSGGVEHNLYLSGGIILKKEKNCSFVSPFFQTIYNWQP